VVRKDDTVEDVLLGQRCHIGHVANYDAIACDHGRMRADAPPRDYGFWVIAHYIEHTPPSALGEF
jgi:hypothetical protein